MKSFTKCHKWTPKLPITQHKRFFTREHNRTTIPADRYWNPNKIYPVEPKHVRVTGITLRDGHQSLNGGMHRIDLLSKAAPLIDKIRPASMEYPGSEEIGGGTTVDFPLRFKGENPFRNMETIASQMPNTPTSALIRSDSLCGYNINPRDVTNTFIKYYARAGIDIFRVFDAYNNVSNHATVAQAVLDNNKHYQAAITFTSHADPTLFNVKWVRDLAKEFANMGAHSICIKDMAGIASPALMQAWVAEIKDALPQIPVIIHSHYTTGFSPLSYLLAIEAGASAVDCGISTLSGRSGHPAMEVFNQVLSDMGYDLGWDPLEALEAMKPVADLYREYHPRYEFCEMKMAGSVDYRVFTQGIPGGQISIMRNELVRNGYGHLFDNVIEQIQRVRTQVGGVALVTPTSEHVARQSIVNAMNNQSKTTDDSPLWPGYSEMLRGTMGRPPMKMETDLQKRALREWTQDQIKKMGLENDDLTSELQSKVPQIVDMMWQRSVPVQATRDIADLSKKIENLREIDESKFSDRIKEFEQEIQQLSGVKADQAADDEYTSILRGDPSDSVYNDLLTNSGLKSYVDGGNISREQFLGIIKCASFCTVCPSSILTDGMEKARLEVEELAVEKDFEIPPRGSDEFEEFAVLQCMFRHAQNIALYWFQNHANNVQFWDKNFPPDFEFDRDDGRSGPQPLPIMYPYVSRAGAETVGKTVEIDWSETELKRVLNNDLKALKEQKTRLANLEAQDTQNKFREILKDRAVNRTKEAIGVIESEIRAKLKTSMYNVRSHDAGYSVDVANSVDKNFQRAQAL